MAGVIGTDKVAPPGKIVASFAPPTVKFGEPLDFSRYEGMEGDRLILRAVTYLGVDDEAIETAVDAIPQALGASVSA